MASYAHLSVRTVLSLAVVLLAVEGAAAAAGAAYASPLEFWRAEPGEVAARMQVTSLDPASAVDASILAAVRDLDTQQTADLLLRSGAMETSVGWAAETFAHPRLGIGLDRRLRPYFEQAAARDPDGLSHALRFPIAYAHAQTLQFRVYTLESLARRELLPLLEAQALVLGALTLSQGALFEDPPVLIPSAAVRDGLRVLAQMRQPSWFPMHRFRLPDRRRLAAVGLKAGRSYVWAFSCITLLDDPEHAEVLETVRASIVETHAADPRLPDVDPVSCESEDVFDWSRAAARTLLP